MATKIYFHNAFSVPKLIANSLKELKNNLIIKDNYRGDVTSEVKGIIRLWLKDGAQNLADLKEELSLYDLFINPTLEDFQNKNKRCGLNKKEYL